MLNEKCLKAVQNKDAYKNCVYQRMRAKVLNNSCSFIDVADRVNFFEQRLLTKKLTR